MDVTPRPSPAATPDDAALRTQVLALLPALRAFARSLTRNRTEADDLVQETLMKALANIDRFDPGTNLRAWLFTILRNTYYTDMRKRRRETEGLSALAHQDHNVGPSQEWSMTLRTLQEALTHLPDDQREALVLVGAAGLSYEEAADVCGCALGTIKSRVNRARAKLLVLMGAQATADVVEGDAVALSAAHSGRVGEG
ncbi:sigma-70 family RNA polymerase sigma factor [Xanthobacter sp. V4C-4]|uniref:sigma-70 family RNA polymerase sigma factor n=1 Tax=Xanthobacter cornucopiae TaxID=3119924 RepID=UPI003729679B